jgi:hypothetical protein
LGTDAQIRAAVLKASHPGLSICDKSYSVSTIVRSTIAPHAEYAAALTTCAAATGSSPTEVTIVEPYGEGPQVIYAVVTGAVHYNDYILLAEKLRFTGNQLTVSYLGYGPTDSTATPSQSFKQTDTIYTDRFVKGAYVSTGRPS